jgi:ankyrin repeat protein
MPTLYDVAHFCSWNGYAEDTRNYLGVDKASWTNKEFLFPFGADVTYGPKKKTRIQRICEEMLSGYDGKNYYHHCMMRSYDPVARITQLITDRAKPDIKDADGWTALMVCCRNGWTNHDKIVKVLLDGGADINQSNSTYGFTPLLLAANNGHEIIVRELIRRGANLELSTKSGEKPLTCACENGHLQIVKDLVAGGAVVDELAFKAAIEGGQVAVLKYLISLSSVGQIPRNAVFTAVEANKPNIIKTLIKAGADMNDSLPLHLAVRTGAHDCLIALCAGGANLNLLDQDNSTALTTAIQLGNPKAIKVLGEYKANFNIMEDDMSPLHHAIVLYDAIDESKDKRKECILEIINAGPNFKLVNFWGNTAAEDADEKKMHDIVTLIKRAELKQTTKGKLGKKPGKN